MENETFVKQPEKGKFTLIDSLVTAMVAPKEYDKLLMLSKGKIVRYVLVLLLLVCLIQYAIPGLGSIAGLGGVRGILMNETPQFLLEDGKFYLEEKIEQIDEVSGTCFIIDTTVEEYTVDDVPENMMQAVLISQSNMLVYNSMYGSGGTVETQKFEDVKGLKISNEMVADMSVFIYAGLVIAFIVMWIASIAEYLLTALFYAFIVYLFVRMAIQDLEFGTVYKVALFAQTIGVIVEAVTYSLGVEMLYTAGSFFNVFVTVLLMNRVLVRYQIRDS